MNIPLLDLKKQIRPMRKDIDRAIKAVIDRADFILGEDVADFEQAVSRYCGIKYAIAVSNGTDALRLSLQAQGIGYGDSVICPAFTYYATAGAIVSRGARPLFADIDPLTYNISPLEIERVIRSKKAGIKAIIPVHLYGQCAEMEEIMNIAKRYKLRVIEDAAQSFGASYKGRKAGTMGDCAAVSFFPAKNLGAFGDAGMVVTGSKAIADKIRILRNQGNKNKYFHEAAGHNNRMDTIQAAVLKVKLKYLDSWNRKRCRNAEYFNCRLKGLDIVTPFRAGYATHIYHQYVLRLEPSSARLIAHLRNKGIDARVYYPLPLHLQKCFKYLGYKSGDFPESEKASREVLAIPVNPDLSRKEMDYIINSIREFLR